MSENGHRSRVTRSKAPAADRTLTILELLTESERPLSLTEIAIAADVPLASCSAIMRTLEARGYAVEHVSGRTHHWQPTLAIYKLGARLIVRLGLAESAQPHIEQLADELGMPASAGVLENDQVIYLAKAAGPSFVQFHTFVGRAVPFGTTAIGKAIAAFLPVERRIALVGEGRGTRRALAELEESSRLGYAIEDEEEYEGIACAAAPVFDATGRCCGGISVTGFRADVLGDARRERTITAVRTSAAAISAEMGAPERQLALLRTPVVL